MRPLPSQSMAEERQSHFRERAVTRGVGRIVFWGLLGAPCLSATGPSTSRRPWRNSTGTGRSSGPATRRTRLSTTCRIGRAVRDEPRARCREQGDARPRGRSASFLQRRRAQGQARLSSLWVARAAHPRDGPLPPMLRGDGGGVGSLPGDPHVRCHQQDCRSPSWGSLWSALRTRRPPRGGAQARGHPPPACCRYLAR